jgi:SAM-dependent methyltransferase
MARTPNIAPNRDAVHPFDLKYGTDTGGYLGPEELAGGGIHDRMNNGYSAVAPSVFHEACRRWREMLPSSASRLEAYTFVDVGAGKGRTLLMAAELAFRKVIGVELNAGLASIAERNIVIWSAKARSRTKIHITCQDALEFNWPRSPLLIYLNNPFECALVEQLAARVAGATAGRSVDLLYVNPACADSLTRSGVFELLWDEQIEMSAADQLADPYGAVADRVAAFRIRRRI